MGHGSAAVRSRAVAVEEGLPITLAAADRGQPGRQPLAVAGGTALRPGAQGAFDTQTDVTDAEGSCRHATTAVLGAWLESPTGLPVDEECRCGGQTHVAQQESAIVRLSP